MSSDIQYGKILITTGCIAGIAGLIYYLCKDEEPGVIVSNGGTEGGPLIIEDVDDTLDRVPSSDIPATEVLQIMEELKISQDKMKGLMAEICVSINSKEIEDEFAAVYKVALEKSPPDPLALRNIDLNTFDSLLEREQNDPRVRDLILQLMSGGSLEMPSQSSSQSIPVSKIVKIHKFMSKKLESLVDSVEIYSRDISKCTNLDQKTVTLTCQILVAAAVEAEFGIKSDELEHSVMMNHEKLAIDPHFANITHNMQEKMSRLMEVAAQ